ncbi:iron uptake system protein EfeO [Pseudarthrobacter sp. J1738]|uniref:iron uptake system protein EfeO n=1 Tax=Pseudarthrobacter sp. J1738 TaxID=3420446 RepID=UPI003D2A4916
MSLVSSPKRQNFAAAGAALALLAPLALTACTDNTAKPASSSAGGPVAVTSTTDACQLSATGAKSGPVTFEVKNDGADVTEFYLLAEDGLRIIGEVENIGPGITRNLVVTAPAGTYQTACKPGMQGDGIRASFTVEESGTTPSVSADVQKLTETATGQYTAYVKDQTEQLLTGTKDFAAAFASGDAAKAKGLYASVRMHWERIEPVAESFGDLDPKLDLREADLEAGQKLTGWHRAEKDIFPPASYKAMTEAERKAIADQLVADTQDLYTRTRTVKLTADQLGNGAKELLDEVATGKVTGEEEIWSHTDLWDFQANIDGARIAFENLRPVLLIKDAALATKLDAQFKSLQAELDKFKDGEGFTYYNDLTPAQVKTLAASVDSLAEPLSKLTAAVVL